MRFFLLVMAACGAGAASASAEEIKPPFDNIGIDQHLNTRLPLDLSFRDESGNAVRLSELIGKRPVILTLNYYRCPMLCTLVLNGLVSALRPMNMTLGRDFDIVTVSIDPRDTPAGATEKKASYIKEYGRPEQSGGWHFLVGDEPSIRSLADAAGFRYVYDEKTDQYAHAAGIMIVTPEGRMARYYYGIEYAPKDLRLSLVEAGKGKTGTIADRLLLLCYQYDPATGHYGATAYLVMRAGGALTVLCLGSFITVMLWRDARQARRRAA